MPNWCKNFLRVSGPDRDLAHFMRQAAPAKTQRKPKTASPPEAFSFQRLVPLSVLRGTATEGEESTPANRWGCRGDAIRSQFDESRDGAAQYRFATPWNPPMKFLREVSELWPTLEFILDYDEPMLTFYGTVCARAGRITHFYVEPGLSGPGKRPREKETKEGSSSLTRHT